MTEPVAAEVGRDFIRDIIQADLDQGKYREIVTRFPPEPNGYLHIGHAKSIALNFGIAQEFPGRCHLRFDDTNPVKEEQEYIDSIQADVRWLGFDWGKNLFFASDYFDRLYEWAEKLIGDGLAYVDDQTQEEIRLSRGTLTEPGKNSPFRDRGVDENLDLFRRMKAGEFPNGARVLRAKIDMAAGNINLRDPVLYRILHAHHPRTGTKWHIYPSYDYAHGQSDAIEGITHSICTLEFEDHRPLYDWFIEKLPVPSQPHQYEFARLNLTYTLLSKRVLTQLVRDGHVAGWDDPRMPTMAGMRRRGVPPAALREFVKRIGVAKANSVVDVGMLEFCIREELNRTSQRRMGVLRPLKVVIENYPEGQTEETRGDQPSGRSQRGHAKNHVRPRALYRAGRLHGDPAEEVLPPVAGQRGAAALRLFRQVHRCDQERQGRGGGAALHLRSRDQGRQRARRPQGQGDHALAAGGYVRARGDPHLQPAVRQSEPGRFEFRGRSQSEFAGDPARRSHRGVGGGEQRDRTDAVRASGLFRARQGLDARQAGVLTHDRPARYVREGSRERMRIEA